MKRALVICYLLIHVLSYFPAEAKAPVASKYPDRNETAHWSKSLFDVEHPADLTPSTQFAFTNFRVREKRLPARLISSLALEDRSPLAVGRYGNIYPLLPHLSLVRLLLFPKHYFW
jgi:hypothetical protein